MKKPNNPLVSIIVPVFNGEEYILDCFSCIRKQSYKNIECIFCDDGSEDRSVSILDSLASFSNVVILKNKTNIGAFGSRLASLSKAKGEYSTFLDVDDKIDSDYIEKMVNYLDSSCAEVIVTNFDKTNFDGDISRKKQGVPSPFAMSNLQVISALLSAQYGINFWVIGGKLAPTKTLLDVYNHIPIRVKISEDILTNFCLFEKTEKTFYATDIFYHYIDRPNSLAKKGKKSTDAFDNINVWHYIFTDTKNKYPQNSETAANAFCRAVFYSLGKALQTKAKVFSRENFAVIKVLLNEPLSYLSFFKRIFYRVKIRLTIFNLTLLHLYLV